MYCELFPSNYENCNILEKVKYCKLNAYRIKNNNKRNHSKQSTKQRALVVVRSVDHLAG